tara:strand:- start:1021 stop:2928 length:1908 start_codon:yes stop_codon:yes gene_type:complete
VILDYCNNLTQFSRFETREVLVGNVGIGGGNPIRVQSMTTVETMKTDEVVAQCVRMINNGCELVRLTAPSIKDAKNLYNIKNKLIKKGYENPLIADIHFTPNAAIEAAKLVEKVRINPGNFVDKKKFNTYNYSRIEYLEELNRLEDKLIPLIEVCQKYKTAMRIGTNHGSLSDRIMSYYGDTPMGMVESALELVRICEKSNYHDIILSMKASNPIVMIQAYRLLVYKMKKENMNYPLHLGVTEAGEGRDGRIKSAIGIGSLLLDGIGDTIRVSLTETPENEIPVAQSIIHYIDNKKNHPPILPVKKNPINAFSYSKRYTNSVMNIGGGYHPVVIVDVSHKGVIQQDEFSSFGYKYIKHLDKWIVSDVAADYIFLGNNKIEFQPPGSLRLLYHYKSWLNHKTGYPVLSVKDYLNQSELSNELNVIFMSLKSVSSKLLQKLKQDSTAVILLDTENVNGVVDQRRFFVEMINKKNNTPVIIRRSYQDSLSHSFQIHAAIDFGALLLDGLGNGVWSVIEESSQVNEISFDILQATRTRISKTEYISCPSCGRTQFDLEKTTAQIRLKTSHLKGIKIGVMGCIVNGPGEMADADYGYVGMGKNKISLYKKQEMVKKNIDAKDALDELIQLIKDNGDWVDC